MTAVFVCSRPSDLSALATRGFAAIPAGAWNIQELRAYREQPVRVLRHDREAARGACAVLRAMSCDVQVLLRDVDPANDDVLAAETTPMFKAADAPLGDDPPADGTEMPGTHFKAASGRLIELAYADELDGAAGEADELIERTLTRGAMSVFYGDSNSGKTFLALDIACSLTRGLPWLGRNVEQGAVVYLATESPASIKLRLRAYQKHHGCVVPNLAIVGSPIDLYNGGDDTQAVIDIIRHIEGTRGVKVELIVGDTLSRLSAGANENSGEDMSVVVRHVDRIRSKCNAHFALIHHTGKDAAKGARGWSGIRAATDTEIEVAADDALGVHSAEVTKQRDIPGKGDRLGFRLEVVELGIGKWGKPITSCVIAGTDAPPRQQARRLSEIAGAIVECLTTRGCGMKKRELIEHLSRYDSSAVYREIKKLCEADKLHVVSGVVGLRK